MKVHADLMAGGSVYPTVSSEDAVTGAMWERSGRDLAWELRPDESLRLEFEVWGPICPCAFVASLTTTTGEAYVVTAEGGSLAGPAPIGGRPVVQWDESNQRWESQNGPIFATEQGSDESCPKLLMVAIGGGTCVDALTADVDGDGVVDAVTLWPSVDLSWPGWLVVELGAGGVLSAQVPSTIDELWTSDPSPVLRVLRLADNKRVIAYRSSRGNTVTVYGLASVTVGSLGTIKTMSGDEPFTFWVGRVAPDELSVFCNVGVLALTNSTPEGSTQLDVEIHTSASTAVIVERLRSSMRLPEEPWEGC
jgi:hypothetical protein